LAQVGSRKRPRENEAGTFSSRHHLVRLGWGHLAGATNRKNRENDQKKFKSLWPSCIEIPWRSEKSRRGTVTFPVLLKERMVNNGRTGVEPPEVRPLVPTHAELIRALWEHKRSGRWGRAFRQPHRVLLNRLGYSVERQWQEEFVSYAGWPKNVRSRLGCLPDNFITGASLKPDIACRLYELVRDTHCEKIVECGSGISTIIIALAIGDRSITFVSLEESEHWLEITKRALMAFDVLDRVQLVYSPLTPIEFNGKRIKAHDDSAIANGNADVLLVDAPPAKVGRMGVLPRMTKHLRPGALVLLDDAVRGGEEECVRAWVDNGLANLEGYLALGTGMAVLKTK